MIFDPESSIVHSYPSISGRIQLSYNIMPALHKFLVIIGRIFAITLWSIRAIPMSACLAPQHFHFAPLLD